MKSRKETVSIEDFPEITIIRPEKVGGVVSVQGSVESYYTKQTEFGHAVVTFGNFFDQMRCVVSVEQRWGVGQQIPQEVAVFPNNPAMDNLTRIANTPGAYENFKSKRKYRSNLKKVLRTIGASELLNIEVTKIAVKRAGVVAAEFLHGSKVPLLIYEAKRLPLVDGTLAVGMDDEEKILTSENLAGKEIEIDEVFLASGSTILAFIIDCYSRDIKPKNLTIIAPFVAQQGAEAVLELSSKISWKTKILATRIYYWLNNHWYVLVTPEEKIWREVSGDDLNKEVQAGGDAGDLTEID